MFSVNKLGGKASKVLLSFKTVFQHFHQYIDYSNINPADLDQFYILTLKAQKYCDLLAPNLHICPLFKAISSYLLVSRQKIHCPNFLPKLHKN